MTSRIFNNRLVPLSRRPVGFTLVELIIVLTIIMVLMALGIAATKSVMDGQKTKATRVILESVSRAMVNYCKAWGVYPDTGDLANFYSDLRKPERGGPYLTAIDDFVGDGRIVDAWGRDVRVVAGTAETHWVPIVQSSGPDRVWDTGDDISSID